MNAGPKSVIEQYADNQRAQYNSTAVGRESAERQVAPNYDELRALAPNYVNLMLREYCIRAGSSPSSNAVSKMSFLDFGCGVGRVMEALTEMGCEKVDGADISDAMLAHARKSPILKNSKLYLTNGYNLGNAPHNEYDIVFSFLCLHHIPMRVTRLKIIEHMAACLKPGGMCFVELKLFPGVTPERIPANHAHWTENKPSKFTNSKSDVWLTPDSIGLVYQDFALFFKDVFMLEAETQQNHFEPRPEAIYTYSFNPFFVGGFKGARMYQALNAK